MKSNQSISNLLTNKFFLYVIFFLSVLYLFGYMMAGDVNFILLFILVSLIVHIFTKNMIIVLAISFFITTLVKGGFVIKESLVNSTTTEPLPFYEKQKKYADFHDHDPSYEELEWNKMGLEALENMDSEEDEDEDESSEMGLEGLENMDSDEDEDEDESSEMGLEGLENMDSEEPEEEVEEGTIEPNTNMNILANSSAASIHGTSPESFEVGKKNNTKIGSRIDYSSTIEEAYDNLDKMLGSDGIQRLSGDTQKLMEQQMKLAEAMKNMGPLLENANSMLQTINTSGGGIESLLKNSGGIQSLLGNMGGGGESSGGIQSLLGSIGGLGGDKKK